MTSASVCRPKQRLQPIRARVSYRLPAQK